MVFQDRFFAKQNRSRKGVTRRSQPISSIRWSRIWRKPLKVMAHGSPKPFSGPDSKLRTLGVSIGRKGAENFEYSTIDTAAHSLFTNSAICLIPVGVQARFPADRILRDCAASGYAAVPLVDSSGAVLGLLALVSRDALANARFVTSQLRIFASRATAELERRRAHATANSLEASQSAERLTGFTRAEMLGRNVLMPGIMPEEESRLSSPRRPLTVMPR
jgi:hypothetical protein